MKTKLDAIEKEWRRDIRRRARRVSRRPNLFLTGVVAALVTPSSIAIAFFVPFLGQLLLLGNLALTLSYILIKRSFALALSISVGVASGIGLMVFVANTLPREAAAFYYLVMAFSMFLAFATFLIVLGRIWTHYEDGRIPSGGEVA